MKWTDATCFLNPFHDRELSYESQYFMPQCINFLQGSRQRSMALRVIPIPPSSSASWIPRTITLQDRWPKSYWRRGHALLGIANRHCPLGIGCEPYIINCDTALECLNRISFYNSQPSVLIIHFCWHPIFFLSPSCNLTQPVPPPTLKFLGSQSPVSLPTHQRRSPLLTLSRLVVPISFHRHVALLHKAKTHDRRGWFSKRSPHLLICTRSGRVI